MFNFKNSHWSCTIDGMYALIRFIGLKDSNGYDIKAVINYHFYTVASLSTENFIRVYCPKKLDELRLVIVGLLFKALKINQAISDKKIQILKKTSMEASVYEKRT